MATTVGTSPAEVKNEIDTDLSDSDINSILDLVERDIDRTYTSPDFDDDQHRIDFEAVLAALRIAEGNAPDAQDRSATEVGSGQTDVVYEESFIASLRQRVRRRDPQSSFGYSSAVRRDSDRYVTSGTPRSDE